MQRNNKGKTTIVTAILIAGGFASLYNQGLVGQVAQFLNANISPKAVAQELKLSEGTLLAKGKPLTPEILIKEYEASSVLMKDRRVFLVTNGEKTVAPDGIYEFPKRGKLVVEEGIWREIDGYFGTSKEEKDKDIWIQCGGGPCDPWDQGWTLVLDPEASYLPIEKLANKLGIVQLIIEERKVFAFDVEEQRVKIPDGLYILENQKLPIKGQEINCDPKVCDPPQGKFTFNEKSDLSIPQRVDVKAIFASVQR
ncbi:hypothetical protein Riv7116_4444 [Rivularia sp. PCC 7116]|uniref:hypothetical protein n=1 Tax=Rivularia sp. PCC 7116 TaxID=373994 RepID=UPI00029F3DC7|nr:hypothetical protein [Rivularia sp. PCC 7116]AFY56865.1 hypothetical protein Riv7116_4444 [Rivularia sp. PCC 7116]